MAQRKIKGEFFFILLLITTVIVSVVILQNRKSVMVSSSAKKTGTENILLSNGWNLVSTTLDTGLDAKSVCNLAQPTKLGICKYNKGYVCRACGNPTSTENFPIVANEGYFIYSWLSGYYNLSLTGVHSQSIPFLEGYAIVGFPKESEDGAMASKLCGRYLGTDHVITKINKYTENGTYLEYSCSSNTSVDFQIERNKAYWVLSELLEKPGSSKSVKDKPSVPQNNP